MPNKRTATKKAVAKATKKAASPGVPAAQIGTVGARVAGKPEAKSLKTTKDLIIAHNLLRRQFTGQKKEAALKGLLEADVKAMCLKLAEITSNECPAGTHYEPGLGCVPNVFAVTEAGIKPSVTATVTNNRGKCPPGTHYEEGWGCVPDEWTAA